MPTEPLPPSVLPYTSEPEPPTVASRLGRILRTRSFWALADQAIASASNYVTTILLIRYLPKEEVGRFTIPWELLLLLNSLHAALIVYPLSVRGAKLAADRLRQISTVALILTLLLTVPFGSTLFAMGATQYWLVGLCAAGALVAFQIHETLRKSLMAHFRYTDLIWGDAVAYLGTAGSVLVMNHFNALSVPSVFAAMAVFFLLASIVQVGRVKPLPTNKIEIREVGQEFWVLGRWMLASNLTMVFTSFGVQWCLAKFQGYADVGNFQALASLLKLTNPMVQAMSGLIVPAVAAAGRPRAALKYILLGGSILAPYFLLLLIVPGFVLSVLYGDRAAEYAPYVLELRLSVATATAGYATAMLLAVLAGMGQARAYFYAQVINTITSILFIIPAAAIYGWTATLIAGLCAMILTGLTAFLLLLRIRKQEPRRSE
jgi:O-antigen/teichoic acid export membrane protein